MSKRILTGKSIRGVNSLFELIQEFWPTLILGVFYSTHLVRWPPHYEDEAWIWTPAMNSILGFGTSFPSFGYSTDPNPLFNFVSAILLRLSPFDFWITVRGLALLSLIAINLTSSRFFKKVFSTNNTWLFQALLMSIPLADGLLFARLEVFAFAIGWLAILMQTSTRRAVRHLSGPIFAIAVTIHPLTLVLSLFLFVQPGKHLGGTRRNLKFLMTKHLRFSLLFALYLILLNLKSLLSWREYQQVLRRTGSSSRAFSDEDRWNFIFMPLRSIWKLADQFAKPNALLENGYRYANDGVSWQIVDKGVAGILIGFLVMGTVAIARRQPGWLVASLGAIVIHSLLVVREETYYLIVLAPIFVAPIIIRYSLSTRHPKLWVTCVSICTIKMLTVTYVPSLYSSVVQTQYALNAESPYDYSRQLDYAIPENSVVVGTIVLRAVLENRSDVAVYGITALTEPNDGFGQRIDNCEQVQARLLEIWSRHPGKERLLVLFGTWQSRAFSQYSTRFDDSDFECLIRDVVSTRSVTGVSDNGVAWEWVIRSYGTS